MYWNENARNLILFKEDLRSEFIYDSQSFEFLELKYFKYKTRLFLEANIINFYDEELYKFRCFKNRYGETF